MLNIDFDNGILMIDYLNTKKNTEIEKETLFNIKHGFLIRYKLGDETIDYDKIKQYYTLEDEDAAEKEAAEAAPAEEAAEAAPAEEAAEATKAKKQQKQQKKKQQKEFV